uniref:Cysteine protease n=1 Tax=Zea mays TaxID=4577 RepID=A0A804RHW1_MAIZE
MVRSSQMLVAQALIFHHLGRSWRKPPEKPYNPDYIGVLRLFGDSEACAFSIHNLLQARRNYGLAAGSWLGPYAMCRAWQTLIRTNREQADAVDGKENFPMALYVVSGDEDGERGGAPVVYIDVAAQLCSDFNKGPSTWSPILLLVPLVLGLDKINPRYIPLLKETFMFPQSLGILGGKPGTSTYIAGVQDDRALYLDPHEVQMQFLFHRPLESGYFCWSEVHLRIIPRDAPLLESVGPQKCLAFSTDGAKFAIGGEDGHLRIFHWPSIKVLLDEPKAHKSFRDMDIRSEQT